MSEGPAEDRRFHARLDELRRDLRGDDRKRRARAADTLLSLLWVRMGGQRFALVCALCDAPPQPEEDAPPAVARLCARLDRSPPFNPFDLPDAAQLRLWVGGCAGDALTDALHAAHAALCAGENPAQQETLRRESAACLELLRLVERLEAAPAADACARALRVFTTERERGASAPGRATTLVRDAAARALGALPPDSLYALWSALGGSPEARRDLLPALDYLTHADAAPYLMRLLDRRAQWPDGEMAAWFLVRALGRIGDRRALPALRRLAAADPDDSALRTALPSILNQSPDAHRPSAELAREARRVVEALEGGKKNRSRMTLLRPAMPPTGDLLRPAEGARGGGPDLLRPDPDSPETRRGRDGLLRPADPQADALLRPSAPSDTGLLRPASDAPREPDQDRDRLLRPNAPPAPES